MSRLAVLVDADNVPPGSIGNVLATIETLGDPIVRQLYGGAQPVAAQKWSKIVSDHAFSVMRQVPQCSGHNATDIEMVIGAMDLLANRSLDGFCLVSSDSDFTALAIRLRASGRLVYGFGGDKTRPGFRNACRDFFPLTMPAEATSLAERGAAEPALTETEQMLMAAFGQCEQGGWALLSAVGHYLRERQQQQKMKKLGTSLSKLIGACDGFELRRDGSRSAYRPSGRRSGSQPKLKLVRP